MSDQPRCDHWEKIVNRFGKDTYRQCPDVPVDQVEGFCFCARHMPPGPKWPEAA